MSTATLCACSSCATLGSITIEELFDRIGLAPPRVDQEAVDAVFDQILVAIEPRRDDRQAGGLRFEQAQAEGFLRVVDRREQHVRAPASRSGFRRSMKFACMRTDAPYAVCVDQRSPAACRSRSSAPPAISRTTGRAARGRICCANVLSSGARSIFCDGVILPSTSSVDGIRGDLQAAARDRAIAARRRQQVVVDAERQRARGVRRTRRRLMAAPSARMRAHGVASVAAQCRRWRRRASGARGSGARRDRRRRGRSARCVTPVIGHA